METKRIHVQYHVEGGQWWADSPDVQGFSAAAPDYNTLRIRTRSAITEIIGEPVMIVEQGRILRSPQEPSGTESDWRAFTDLPDAALT
jgi:hypothetical protein